MRYCVKQTIQWLAAFLLVFFCGNLICFGFYRPSIEIPRGDGANNGFWMPGMSGWYAKEGFGVIRADRNGYPNPDLAKAESYYLIVGSSHTEAVYLMPGESYPEILNDRMGREELHFYSIAHGGFWVSEMLERLDAMEGEFPDAKGLIMEFFSVDLDEDDFEAIFAQRGMDETDPQVLFDQYSEWAAFRIRMKRYIPLLAEWGVQWKALKYNNAMQNEFSGETAAEAETESVTEQEYRRRLTELMSELSTYFGGNIIILYHPMVEINGTYQVINEDRKEIFATVCEECGITFLDLSTAFEEAYEDDNIVPYGFWNTSMGEGHMNADGHRIAADALWQLLSEETE